jgi:hypothetical protein
MELAACSGQVKHEFHNGCVAKCTVGVLCDSDILPLLELCNSDAVVWVVGESEGKAYTENRETIQDIGVDVLIHLQKREVRKTLIFMTRVNFFYPVC